MKFKWMLAPLILALCLAGCASEAVPETTVPPTQTEAPPTTLPAETEPVWADNIHSGIREDGTFTDGALFIGDSLTYGLVKNFLQEYELIGQAKYMSVVGAPLSRFFSTQKLGLDGSSAWFSSEFYGLSYSEAVAQVGESATAIYLMLGTNYTPDTDAEHYMEVVDYLLETCPNATVHLQLIPISESAVVDYKSVNENLRQVLEHYRDRDVQRVMLIDTFTAIGLSQGYDGIHLNADGLDAWYMALVANARNNNLPE